LDKKKLIKKKQVTIRCVRTILAWSEDWAEESLCYAAALSEELLVFAMISDVNLSRSRLLLL
jgi:hypothetical protein